VIAHPSKTRAVLVFWMKPAIAHFVFNLCLILTFRG